MTSEKEIKITPEMIEAGESIIYSKLGSGLPAYLTGAELAELVYMAMADLAPEVSVTDDNGDVLRTNNEDGSITVSLDGKPLLKDKSP